MFEKNTYSLDNLFLVSAPFMQKRKKIYHSGIDYRKKLAKKIIITNTISGVVRGVLFHDSFGKMIIIKHNAKYVNGVDDVFFSGYCHLHEIFENITYDKFVKFGTKLGKMGNSGKSKTQVEKNVWRYLTEKEIKDENETRGVHLHLMFFQVIKKRVKTKLIKELEKTINLKKKDYFWQWDRVYINPIKIYEYFKYIQNQ